ncbi:MAG: DUF6691 family protein [Myxococcota bacterium]|nr:DUF6691 family protein [Myxococcota bacterium]
MKALGSAFFAGGLFGLGLVLSGMTQPKKVFDFLNVTEVWDPSLALVMAGALLVYVVGAKAVKGWERPLLEDRFRLPTRSDLAWPLFIGAVLFGLGWALSGFCPGPALVALGGGMGEALLFIPAMVGGMLIHRFTLGRSLQGASGDIE